MRAVLRDAVTWPVVLLGLLQQTRSVGSLASGHNSSHEGGCLRAADILSCAGLGLDRLPADVPASVVTLDLSHNRLAALRGGSFEGLLRLHTVRLAHNRLTAILPGAFRNSSGALLRHLDLSSNKLRAVEEASFRDLPGLEELLLFNNLLVKVERNAVAGLGALRRLYLSHNRLLEFPFLSIREHPGLLLLDLSSNRLPRLPLENLTSLPGRLQQTLYLHANPLVCDCAMYRMFRLWELRGYPPVTEFRRDYTCLMYGVKGLSARFLPNFPQPCNATAVTPQSSDVAVNAGRPALLHCSTTLTGKHVTFFWVSPHQEYVSPPGNNGSLKMFVNGSLEIVAARAEDSGVYWCMARDTVGRRNETQEVNVTVVMQHANQDHDSFNTGFTTLLGCVVSLILVLMYLYLTPCRCRPCNKGAGPAANEAGLESAQSSILSPTPPATTEGPGRKVSTNRHVVFLEPVREQQNGRVRVAGAVQGHLGPGLLLEPEARQTLRRDAKFPDTSFVLP
ncbi:amphoterin-induced protein 3 [Hippocampus comes]|uniref:Adhesion molecule with Ig like domain 3 n=1 Tax=Hippocampus comes TaxID=109280 RepID=A0A3Q3DGF2_HIPCM|nr:PREDICTED: amphoterin-induced protein 3 [Hippocampus comes]